MTVEIRSVDLACLTEHTEACWPDEACALIVGQYLQNQHWRVNRVELAKNIAENKSRFFEIDPALQIRVEMNTFSEANEIIGIFHSHPEGEAVLSETDIKSIRDPNLFWLIASTSSGKVKEFCAFVVDGGHNINRLTLHSICAANGDWFI